MVAYGLWFSTATGEIPK